ncbi:MULTISPECIES: hypothetical protein [unclassified Corallococcus]|uniref:hypothetical protein n=1 Tax=unclassified Corallococcus TaxID=2685029 RepID=UPI001A8D48A3|nr:MULTISPECIES: hypothetical protein [unclassified Corallococcus]MBN9682584.1 hypothetical protein [Corallococcus sp. NCSPR001]WAS85870.1 hypothetical protein O0N60_02595 [Corallococcus sp. NCRR]
MNVESRARGPMLTGCSPDLRKVAEAALNEGRSVELHTGSNRQGVSVETLVVDEDRAGQSVGGTAVWGDWNWATHTLRTDEDTDLVLTVNGEPAEEN